MQSHLPLEEIKNAVEGNVTDPLFADMTFRDETDRMRHPQGNHPTEIILPTRKILIKSYGRKFNVY